MTSCDYADLDKAIVALPAEGIGRGTLEVTESGAEQSIFFTGADVLTVP